METRSVLQDLRWTISIPIGHQFAGTDAYALPAQVTDLWRWPSNGYLGSSSAIVPSAPPLARQINGLHLPPGDVVARSSFAQPSDGAPVGSQPVT